MSTRVRLSFLFGGVLGAISFAFGFWGPLLLGPVYPQIPPAIFTAPLALASGFFLGGILEGKGVSVFRTSVALVASALVVAALTLLVSIPGKEIEGFVVKARVISCQPVVAKGNSLLVLRLQVFGETRIYASRSRWSYGQLSANTITPTTSTQRSFVRAAEATCAEYNGGSFAEYALDWVHAVELEPNAPGDSTFVPMLQSVPKRYHEAIGNKNH